MRFVGEGWNLRIEDYFCKNSIEQQKRVIGVSITAELSRAKRVQWSTMSKKMW